METESKTLTIGYWKIRGLVQHILYLLNYTGTEYNFVGVTDRPTWVAGKQAMIDAGFDFPNLPYIQDGDVQMSECLAITLHVAEKYGDASLLYTPETRARFYELWGVVKDVAGSFTGIGYGASSDEDLKTKMGERLEFNKYKLQVLNNIVGKQKWLMGNGENLTIIDFLAAEMVERLQTMSKATGVNVLENYPNFEQYLNNFIAIPQIKAFRESDSFMAGPWNNTHAFWK